jgi:hypothetical protein
MFSGGVLRKMIRRGLFSFMAAFTLEFVGPRARMGSLAGRNNWRNVDGPLSSLIGRE